MAIILLVVCICAALHRNVNGFNAVPKVVGGQFASISDFPHAASLGIVCVQYHGGEEFLGCGSSIVNQWVLLTAAHCVAGCRYGSSIIASVGHIKKRGPNIYSVQKYAVHEDYKEVKLKNDIGLLRLNQSLSFGSSVRRIALVQNIPRDEVAYMAGWGYTGTGENSETVGRLLKSVVQYVREDKYCKKKISGMPKGTICASSGHKAHYPSMGDSGGALIVRGYLQIGLVSYKNIMIPDLLVYTNIGYFYDWIQKAIDIVLDDCII